MIHQLRTLLAALHLVQLNETRFRWTAFKLSEVCNWQSFVSISSSFLNVDAKRNQHSSTWGSSFERPMTEKVESRKYRLESQNFISPPSSPLSVCLFLGLLSRRWVRNIVYETHAEWQISSGGGRPFLHPSFQRRDKNHFLTNLVRLIKSTIASATTELARQAKLKWF